MKPAVFELHKYAGFVAPKSSSQALRISLYILDYCFVNICRLGVRGSLVGKAELSRPVYLIRNPINQVLFLRE